LQELCRARAGPTEFVNPQRVAVVELSKDLIGKADAVQIPENVAVTRKPNSVPFDTRSTLVERVLRVTTIPLALPSLTGSSDLPGDLDGPSNQRCSAGRLPIWSCSVRGFACHPCYHGRGALLPHLFTLTHAGPVDPPSASRIDPGTWKEWRGLKPNRATPQVNRSDVSGIFSVPLILQVTLTGSYPAHCPAEFGLSSPPSHPFENECGTAVWITATEGLYKVVRADG